LRILFLSLLCLVAGCNPVDDLRVRLAMKEGNLAYLRSDFEGAIARYDQARALDPGRARVHLNAGYSLMALPLAPYGRSPGSRTRACRQGRARTGFPIRTGSNTSS
jgi:hypothetical protein